MSNQRRRPQRDTNWRPGNPPQRALGAPPVDESGQPAEDMTATDRLQAEVDAEQADDGSVVVQLVTAAGAADIRVPHVGTWRSSARAAVFGAMNDLHWAALTLSREDAMTWATLDPTLNEAQAFFRLWQEATGQSIPQSGASRS